MSTLVKHYVTFVSPGTFFAESNTEEVKSWDVEEAKKKAKKILQRYNAVPYAFYFTTRTRSDKDFDSKETDKSNFYYLPHCKIETLEEILARNLPDEEILRDNMRINKFDKVVTTT